MTDLSGRGAMGQKQPKAKGQRKPMRKVSKKRQAHWRSGEGKAELAHMARVKQLPCMICNAPPPSEVHHCINGRYGARKVSGFDTISLCVFHHRTGPEAIHNGKETWAAKHGPDYTYLDRVKKLLANM